MIVVRGHPPGEREAGLDRGEPVWADLVAGTPPLQLDLDERGLPARRGSLTLVEAVFWLALGKAIPHEAWSVAAALGDLARDCVVRIDDLDRQARETTFRPWRDRLRALDRQELDQSVEKLRAAWAAHLLLAQAVAPPVSLPPDPPPPDPPPDVPAQARSAFRRAEPRLLEALAAGALACRGHLPESIAWQALPADAFAHPVAISMERNVLVARHPEAPEAGLIDRQITPWSGLTVDAASVLKAFPSRRPIEETGPGQWLIEEMIRRARAGEPYDRDTMVVALRRFPDLGKRARRALFTAAPDALKSRPGPKTPR